MRLLRAKSAAATKSGRRRYTLDELLRGRRVGGELI